MYGEVSFQGDKLDFLDLHILIRALHKIVVKIQLQTAEFVTESVGRTPVHGV